MSNDSKSFVYAEVDVSLARFSKGDNLGIEFSNEIDVWAQMVFRARQQIQWLKAGRQNLDASQRKNTDSVYYRIREGLP